MPSGKNYTMPQEIRIDYPNVEKRMDKADALIDEISAKYFSDKSLKADKANYMEYKRKAVEEIRKIPGVEKVEMNPTGAVHIKAYGINYMFDFGAHHDYRPEPESMYQPDKAETTEKAADYGDYIRNFINFSNHIEEYRGDDKNTVWSYKTIGIHPFKSQFPLTPAAKTDIKLFKKAYTRNFPPLGP